MAVGRRLPPPLPLTGALPGLRSPISQRAFLPGQSLGLEQGEVRVVLVVRVVLRVGQGQR